MCVCVCVLCVCMCVCMHVCVCACVCEHAIVHLCTGREMFISPLYNIVENVLMLAVFHQSTCLGKLNT